MVGDFLGVGGPVGVSYFFRRENFWPILLSERERERERIAYRERESWGRAGGYSIVGGVDCKNIYVFWGANPVLYFAQKSSPIRPSELGPVYTLLLSFLDHSIISIISSDNLIFNIVHFLCIFCSFCAFFVFRILKAEIWEVMRRYFQ